MFPPIFLCPILDFHRFHPRVFLDFTILPSIFFSISRFHLRFFLDFAILPSIFPRFRKKHGRAAESAENCGAGRLVGNSQINIIEPLTPLHLYTAVYRKSPLAKFMPRPRGRPCLVAPHALRLNQEKKCWHLILRNYPTVLAPKRIGLAGRPASASLSRPSHCRAMIARGHCASSVMLIKCTHAHAHL